MVHGFLRQSFMACCLTWSFGFETDVQVIFPDKLRQLSAIGDGIITNFDAIGFGYTPQSNIVDHARIDLDQADVIQALKFNSFSTARDVYQKGGHSFAVATVMLATPLPRKMPARSVVSGTTISGVNLRASLLKDAPILATALDIVYPFFSEDEETPKCRVGGAMVRDTDGCKSFISWTGNLVDCDSWMRYAPVLQIMFSSHDILSLLICIRFEYTRNHHHRRDCDFELHLRLDR